MSKSQKAQGGSEEEESSSSSGNREAQTQGDELQNSVGNQGILGTIMGEQQDMQIDEADGDLEFEVTLDDIYGSGEQAGLEQLMSDLETKGFQALDIAGDSPGNEYLLDHVDKSLAMLGGLIATSSDLVADAELDEEDEVLYDDKLAFLYEDLRDRCDVADANLADIIALLQKDDWMKLAAIVETVAQQLLLPYEEAKIRMEAAQGEMKLLTEMFTEHKAIFDAHQEGAAKAVPGLAIPGLSAMSSTLEMLGHGYNGYSTLMALDGGLSEAPMAAARQIKTIGFQAIRTGVAAIGSTALKASLTPVMMLVSGSQIIIEEGLAGAELVIMQQILEQARKTATAFRAAEGIVDLFQSDYKGLLDMLVTLTHASENVEAYTDRVQIRLEQLPPNFYEA